MIHVSAKTFCLPLMMLPGLLALLFLTSWSVIYQTVVLDTQQDMVPHLTYMDLLPIEAETMANFANPFHGATIVKGQSSVTYVPPGTGLAARVSSWWSLKQMAVIEHHSPLVPGQCWPFDGDRGRFQVRLADTIHITHVTLGHIAKRQSPEPNNSAPRGFSVYGLKTVSSKATLLGTFEYDQDGPSFQTFTLTNHDDVFRYVRLEINSNWGNEEYTCLYSFRVHGESTTHSPTF